MSFASALRHVPTIRFPALARLGSHHIFAGTQDGIVSAFDDVVRESPGHRFLGVDGHAPKEPSKSNSILVDKE